MSDNATCPICSEPFEKSQVSKHLYECHTGEVATEFWLCGACPFRASSLDKIAAHCFRSTHPASSLLREVDASAVDAIRSELGKIQGGLSTPTPIHPKREAVAAVVAAPETTFAAAAAAPEMTFAPEPRKPVPQETPKMREESPEPMHLSSFPIIPTLDEAQSGIGVSDVEGDEETPSGSGEEPSFDMSRGGASPTDLSYVPVEEKGWTSRQNKRRTYHRGATRRAAANRAKKLLENPVYTSEEFGNKRDFLQPGYFTGSFSLYIPSPANPGRFWKFGASKEGTEGLVRYNCLGCAAFRRTPQALSAKHRSRTHIIVAEPSGVILTDPDRPRYGHICTAIPFPVIQAELIARRFTMASTQGFQDAETTVTSECVFAQMMDYVDAEYSHLSAEARQAIKTELPPIDAMRRRIRIRKRKLLDESAASTATDDTFHGL